jgi:manganese transport protein
VLAWIVALLIIAMNGKLVYEGIMTWTIAAGSWRWVVVATTVPLTLTLALLLIWMMFKRDRQSLPTTMTAGEVAQRALQGARQLKRIGVALDAGPSDAVMLAEALALARAHHAELVLMHVVEGVGGQFYGRDTDDAERRADEQYITDLADRLHAEAEGARLPAIRAVLGYGLVVPELVRLAAQEQIDLLVAGGHGHRGLADLLHGQTIPGVRHGLRIPILAVGTMAGTPQAGNDAKAS